MLSSRTLIAGLALAFPALAIPPPNFGFPEAPNDTALTITFHDQSDQTVIVQEGALYGYEIPEYVPNLSLNATSYSSLYNYTGEYLVLIVDADAITPNDPDLRFLLHWMQPGFAQAGVAGLNSTSANMTAVNSTSANSTSSTGSRSLYNTTTPIVPYLRPMPGVNSSAHRYIYYAFEQPSNFSLGSQWSGLSASNRTHFNLTNFISDHNLGRPGAAMYFYLSNQTDVPKTFIAPPGSTYPGGNGYAVTSGDPYASNTANMASATGTGTGSGGMTTTTGSSGGSGGSGSSSGSASATSKAGAAMVTGMSGLLGAGVVGFAALL